MTREEIKKAIENGESVWVAHRNAVLELCPDMSVKISNSDMPDVAMTTFEVDNGGIVIKRKTQWTDLFFYYEDISKNKAVAEHYAFHKNVTRTETLPFLTWEEFNKNTLGFEFADTIENKYRFHIVRDYRDGKDFIVLYDKNGTISIDEEWEATEENFYKAYDECVRLFRGGE